MNFDAFWGKFCRFAVRSALDFAVFWTAQHFYFRWRGKVEEAAERDELNFEIPLGPGEDLETFGQRKVILGKIWRAIWMQQKYARGGQEIKQWFLDEIQTLSISRYGNAREIQGEIERLPAYEANGPRTDGVRRRT
jgi:hypothetical protein